MKRIALIACLAIFVASLAGAQTVVGSKHDLSAALPVSQRVCVFCHTPHQPEGPPQINYYPLWNHELSTVAAYGTYDSGTFDAGTGGAALNTIADIGGGTAVSNLCMSCHDDTVGVGTLYNDPNIAAGEETPTNAATLISAIGTGSANMGTDLTNDHPVNFTYDNALFLADTELVDPTNAAVAPLLIAGTVQCSSCHDVHDPTFLPFLVASNANSALCLTCHVK
ncbi:MAG: cytochrome c3 family protein [bacterium]|nr:cytochrome c3 family protein [bacterium]